MNELTNLLKQSRFGYKEMKVESNNSAEARWKNKTVIKQQILYNNNTDRFAEMKGTGVFDYSDQISYNNQMSMRIKANTDIEDIRPRPFCSIHIPFNGENWNVYNRISVMVYPKSVGFQNFYFHFSIYHKDGSTLTHAPSLTPNEWNHVLFEFPHFKKDQMVRLSMGPLMMGCPPEALPEIEVYFSNVLLEEVEVDHTLGWNLSESIAYSHVGYITNQQKQAIIGSFNETEFMVKDEQHHIAYLGNVEHVHTEQGDFGILDFTPLSKKGIFYLQIGNKKTNPFEVSDNPYLSSIWKSLHFLKMLRCGDDCDGVHSPCHLTHHTVHPDGRIVGDYGGWHDAGDVSQFEICTAEMAHALLDLAIKVKGKDDALFERILDEARWGCNWLLKTHFGDGHRALAVHYSIWRKNILKDYEQLKPSNQDFQKNIAENGPFENMLAAAALAKSAYVWNDFDEIYAQWCLRIAKQDFAFGLEGYHLGIFTVRWGKGPVSQVAGSICLAACELYSVTKDDYYLDQAIEFAKEVIKCQQVEFPAWDQPIRGFFYEDETHNHLLTYEHRGHEQSPITGIAKLLELLPHHEQANNWKNCLSLYAEYIMSTLFVTKPYGLLPGHIYHYDQLNMIRFTIPRGYGTESEVADNFKQQIKQGYPLGKGYYLRRMPIAIQRRGYHATLLSKAKAVSAIACALGNDQLKQIAIDQLEWVFGKNPFSSSTMYGEGFNYHPLYVAFSRQIVGALPVGIETLGSIDAPYWPVVNNAVFKEVWGHTTGKYLWVLADLI